MQALTASRNFKAAKKQVEACCRCIRQRMCVEGPRRKREAQNKHSGDTTLCFGKSAKLPLRLRIEVIGKVASLEPVEALRE